MPARDSEMRSSPPVAPSVREFYDGFAAEYHLVYGDSWDAAVERQGASLHRLIRNERFGGAQRPGLLVRYRHASDRSCSPGYRVAGTDISELSVERARVEAARLEAHVSFGVADFRDLDSIDGSFDVVISCDNAIPHLLDDADISKALRAMRSKLTIGGFLVIGIRDYDQAMIDRPAVAPPLIIDGPPRRLVVRYHDWDTDGPCYTVHFFVLTEGEPEWSTSHHSTRYRAISREALTRAVADAGFTDITWHEGEDVGYHQRLLQARAE